MCIKYAMKVEISFFNEKLCQAVLLNKNKFLQKVTWDEEFFWAKPVNKFLTIVDKMCFDINWFILFNLLIKFNFAPTSLLRGQN